MSIASGPAAASRGLPLASFLTRLVWLSVLPLLLLASCLAVYTVLDTRADVKSRAETLARNFTVAVDHDLESRIAALRILAYSPLLDDPARWGELYHEAQGYRESFGSHVILADVGQPSRMLFNTRSPYGAVLPLLPIPKGHSAAREALETGKPAVGDTFQGPVAHERMVAIVFPALRQGKPAFLLVSTFETRQFQERLGRLALPDGWAFSLLDGQGEPIARRVPDGFPGPRDSDPEGRTVVRSSLSPWSIVLEIPRAEMGQPLLQAGVALAAGLLLATLTGILGGTRAGRRLAREVGALAEPAASAGPPTEIREVGAVRERLDDAARDRQKALAALHQSEERFRRLFLEGPLAMGFAGKDGRLEAINSAFVRTLGYTLEDVPDLDTWWLKAYPDPEYRRKVKEGWGAVVERAEARSEPIDGGEFRVRCKSGEERSIVISRIVLEDGILATFYDVTDRKAAELEIVRLNASLEQRVAERTAELTAAYQELDAFSYAVSHDLRSPLRVMDGFSNALLEDHGDEFRGQARSYLEQIGIASRRMGELIDAILVLSRSARAEVRRETVDLSALARRRLAERAAEEPGRKVEVAVEEGLVVTGDPRMLEAALGNLIDNAWKYTGKTEAPSIRVTREERGAERWFCVRDNGAGFDAGHAGRLFEPFQRLHRQDEFPGLGVGLATVKRIVVRHGGRVEARGEPGRGATFRFTLPDRIPS